MAELNSLSLMVQRLLDAELLLDTEAAALLTETRTACRALQAGDAAAARRHIEQVARSAETLVATEALDRADGRPVIETARRILASDPLALHHRPIVSRGGDPLPSAEGERNETR